MCRGGRWGLIDRFARRARTDQSTRSGKVMDATLRNFHDSLRSLPMPELRKDPIVGRWVIIATERAKRPVAPRGELPAPSSGLCPFCEGSEVHTPHEILAYRERNSRPNEKGWRVRVVPNKFPALQIEGDLQKRGDGIYD